jgi:hypothetical protein
MVLNTVTSTPQWIRQPKPRGCVFVFVCKYVLGRSRATQPPNLRLCLLRHFGFLTSPHSIPTRSRCHPNSFRLLRRSTSVPHPIPRAHFLHLPTSPRLSLCTSTMTQLSILRLGVDLSLSGNRTEKKDFGIQESDRCKREYRQYRTELWWVLKIDAPPSLVPEGGGIGHAYFYFTTASLSF